MRPLNVRRHLYPSLCLGDNKCWYKQHKGGGSGTGDGRDKTKVRCSGDDVSKPGQGRKQGRGANREERVAKGFLRGSSQV